MKDTLKYNGAGEKSKAIASQPSKELSSNKIISLAEITQQDSNVQKQIQQAANNSSNVMQLNTLQKMADKAGRKVMQLSAVPPLPYYNSVKKENNTGLPDNLKSGVENLSGFSMDDVKVHYNSDKPAQLNALAYAQGTDIHIASGQEKHLPHEAWHVVQQKQGRVKATMQMKEGVTINDDVELEHEADRMGEKAVSLKPADSDSPEKIKSVIQPDVFVQRQQDADKAGKWAKDVVLVWGKSDGKPVTLRILARAFDNHFSPEWENKILGAVQSMWVDIKKRRDEGSLEDLSWGSYVVYGNTTHISFSVDYNKRDDEVVVKHAHAIQNDKHYPAQLKKNTGSTVDTVNPFQLKIVQPVQDAETMMVVPKSWQFKKGQHSADVITQLKYIDVTDHKLKVNNTATVYKVRYEDPDLEDKKMKPGIVSVVFLPSGFDPSLKDVVLDKLGIGREKVLFRNEPNDIVFTQSRVFDLKDKTKGIRAVQLLTEYLVSAGVIKIQEKDIQTLLSKVPIDFYKDMAWKQFLMNAGTFGSQLDRSAETEGAVDSRKPVGERSVGINQLYHTLPAIVHELVHTMEHVNLREFSDSLVEGLTEWVARQATGLDQRLSKSGQVIYKDYAQIIELAIANKLIDPTQIFDAYFNGNVRAVGVLVEVFSEYAYLNEQTFGYKGKDATVGDPMDALRKKKGW